MNPNYTAYAARKDFPYVPALIFTASLIALVAIFSTFPPKGTKTIEEDLNEDGYSDELQVKPDGTHSVRLRNEYGQLISKDIFLRTEYPDGTEDARKEEATINERVEKALSKLEKQ
jgi:hypothetical protein